MTEHFLILLLALLLDRIVGDPPALWRHVPHPVVLFGKAIAFADTRLNRRALPPAQRRRRDADAAGSGCLRPASVSVSCSLSDGATQRDQRFVQPSTVDPHFYSCQGETH